MQVKISQAIPMITDFIKAKLVPMVMGSPGCGKSMIVQQIAKEYGLKVIDKRLSQCDPTDLAGFPKIAGNKASYTPLEEFPIEGDEIPKGYNGWLLFLDEFNSAPLSVQAASYKIVLDKMVGQHKLHKNVAIVCAGNLETDNAIVQPMSTAMQSRLVHLELVVDAQEWVDWASSAGIDHRITDFINFKPSSIYTFQPDHTDKTYACPRTWEFTNRILKTVDISAPHILQCLSGTISEGVAREFVAFCRIYYTLPKIDSILAAPGATEVPHEPSVLFALVGSLSDRVNEESLTPIMKYISRFPIEFQVVFVRSAIRRNKALLSHKELQNWIVANAEANF